MRAILRHSAPCVLVLAGMAAHATRSHAATQDRAAPAAASTLAGITDDARVLGALEELWRLESEEQQPAVVQRLAALRSGAEETYLQGLAITYGPGAAGDHRSALRRETLVELLSGCHPDALRDPLRAAAASDEPALRCAALRLLGEIGAWSQVELLFEAIAERPGAPEPDRQARDLFEEALAGLLARDPAAFDALDQRSRELSPASEVSVVRAVGAAGRVEGLPYLIDVAAWETVPAETALAEIARLAPKVRGPCAVRLGDLLIGHASPERPQACQAATQALGRLGCEQAVEVLIDLLDEEHRGVRESAHWALGRITGQSLALDLERWRAWYDAELDWYSSSGAPLDSALASGDPARIAAALQEVAAHPIFGERFSPGLAEAARVAQPETRLFALHVIELVRSTGTATTLLGLLEDGDPATTERVQATLRHLTGLDGPTSADEWQEALSWQADCSY
jgi:HEAT repeat protein